MKRAVFPQFAEHDHFYHFSSSHDESLLAMIMFYESKDTEKNLIIFVAYINNQRKEDAFKPTKELASR